MMPDVRDEILVFALDIIDNLAAPADPAEGARKLSGNYLGASAR